MSRLVPASLFCENMRPVGTLEIDLVLVRICMLVSVYICFFYVRFFANCSASFAFFDFASLSMKNNCFVELSV